MGLLDQEEEHRLREISGRLDSVYETGPLGNKPDPLDELIFIQLSIRTRQGAYNRTFEGLREACEGDWRRLLDLPGDRLLSLLEPGGMAELKRQRLLDQLTMIIDEFGEATLDPLHEMRTDEAEQFLRALSGVGPKTARCVLLYSLKRPVFPVDSHCLRVLDRLGYVPDGVDRKAAHDLLQELVPVDLRHELHVNLVHHGRSLCLPRIPSCQLCPLVDLCPIGRDLGNDLRSRG